MQNHPFQDGNKRTALLAATVFLRLNGYEMVSREEGLWVGEGGGGRVRLEDAIVGVVVRKWDVEMLARCFEGIGQRKRVWVEHG